MSPDRDRERERNRERDRNRDRDDADTHGRNERGERDTNADSSSSHPDADVDDLELTDAEQDALHELQLAIEHIHRSYGDLLAFHHELGHAMNRMAEAETLLREDDHEEWADELRDDHLPRGAVEDRWTYELVEDFRADFLTPLDEFEDSVRDELAEGIGHVTERRHQRRLRERAEEGDG